MQAPVLRGGVCHGVVVWIDWVFDPLGDIVLSTRPAGANLPSYVKQGVKLLSYPVNVEAAPTQDKIEQKKDDMVATTRVPNCVEVSSSFDSATGEISVDTSFGFLES
jgi:hypothetical protein